MIRRRSFNQPLLQRVTKRAQRRQQRGIKREWLLLGGAALLLAAGTVAIFLHAPTSAPGLEERMEVDGPAEVEALHTNPSDTFCARTTPPVVCAHGGDAASDAPPNTSRAFQAAIDAGSRCAEVDVARTRDGTLVVLHQRELRKLLGRDRDGSSTGRAGAPQVGDFTWDELQRLRWPGGGEGVERVQDVLALLRPHMHNITLDLKPYVDQVSGWREGDGSGRGSSGMGARLPRCGNSLTTLYQHK
jgi:hypothetical protein